MCIRDRHNDVSASGGIAKYFAIPPFLYLVLYLAVCPLSSDAGASLSSVSFCKVRKQKIIVLFFEFCSFPATDQCFRAIPETADVLVDAGNVVHLDQKSAGNF